MTNSRGWTQPQSRKPETIARKSHLLLWSIALLLLTACNRMTNYEEAAMPRFDGTHARGGLTFDGVLDVVTWNIQYAEEIDAAIAELKNTPELQDADILLLQEMDETGVWTIASALSYDYVYFPASVHPENGKNFGNAVLSKWSIVDASKILLPHRNPRNGQMRIAVRATIDVDGHDVEAYSVHIETPWLGPNQRAEQVESSIDPVSVDSPFVVVGGDFNTLTDQGVDDITALMAEEGLAPASEPAQPSMSVAGVGLTPDLIFARGFEVIATGATESTDASDHRPVWTQLRFATDQR